MLAKEIIGNVIKSHIEANNYSQKEVSLLSGISEEELSKLINGKIAISLENSRKISQVFDDLKNDETLLYRVYIDIKENENYDRKELAILEEFEKLELTSQQSKINILRKNIDGQSFHNFKKFILNSSISFSKYKDNPKAKFWLILMYKKYKNEVNHNEFKKSTKSTVYKKLFEHFFQLDLDIKKRIALIKKELYKRGIILKNGPYFHNSLVKGVSFVKNKSRFIFVSDMYKREYRWLISLVHELVHFYENLKDENQIEQYAINLIRSYLLKNKIKDNDFKAFFEAYDSTKLKFVFESKDEYFDKLRKQTKRKVSFGKPEELMNLLEIN